MQNGTVLRAAALPLAANDVSSVYVVIRLTRATSAAGCGVGSRSQQIGATVAAVLEIVAAKTVFARVR